MFKDLKDSADVALSLELQKTKTKLRETQEKLTQATDEIALLREQLDSGQGSRSHSSQIPVVTDPVTQSAPRSSKNNVRSFGKWKK
jgi:hypothetical protein